MASIMEKEFSERLVKVRGAKANKESQELKQTNDIKQKRIFALQGWELKFLSFFPLGV